MTRARLIERLFALLARIEARRVLWSPERAELEELRRAYARMSQVPAPSPPDGQPTPGPSDPPPVSPAGGGGVLTNCYNCAHDWRDTDGNARCVVVDTTQDAELYGAVSDWISDEINVREDGTCLSTATGCPGHKHR